MGPLKPTPFAGIDFAVRQTTLVRTREAVVKPEGKPVRTKPAESIQLSPGAYAVGQVETKAELPEPEVKSKPKPYEAPEGTAAPLVDFGKPHREESTSSSRFILKSVLDSLPRQGFQSATALLDSLGVKPGQKTGKDFDPALKDGAAADQMVDWSAGQVKDLLDKDKQEWASEVLQGKHDKLAGKSVFDALTQNDLTGGEKFQAYAKALKTGAVPAKEVVLSDDIHFVDAYTTELARERGFNGLPTVVEPGKLDEMKAKGEVSELVYRGQPSSFDEDLLANPELKFRTSAGRTTFGPGIYVSQNEGDAAVYINSCRKGEASLLKMGLKKGARIETTANLNKMMEAERTALRKESEKRVQSLKTELSGCGPEDAAQLQKQIQKEQKTLALKEELLFGVQEPLSRDYSRYAINKGYDAVFCQGEHATLNVLNRSALVIERPPSRS